jgi:hypothetical protein
MRFCDCNRRHQDPVRVGCGNLLLCGRCNGYIPCDYCDPESSDSPFMSIACYALSESFACWHHAWVSVAQTMSAGKRN